jgi:hypothetical protein
MIMAIFATTQKLSFVVRIIATKDAFVELNIWVILDLLAIKLFNLSFKRGILFLLFRSSDRLLLCLGMNERPAPGNPSVECF